MKALAKILVIIAAGGAGSRMGGHKPLAILGGRRLIDHALAHAMRHGGPVAVAAPAPFAGICAPHLPDPAADLGPIGALLAGVREAQRLRLQHVMLIGCDMPFLPDDLLPRLADVLPSHRAALAVRGGQVQPLAGLWQCDEPALAHFIATGGRSLHGFAQHQGWATAAWDDGGDDPFANINTPGDLAAAEARLRSHPPVVIPAR